MSSFLQILLSLLFIAPAFSDAATIADTYFLHQQGERIATTEEAKPWQAECEVKKNATSCYDFAVHMAQTLNDELGSVKYYQAGCDLHYEAACFNLGGVLIKDVNTRAKGVEAFKKSCLASKDSKSSKQKREVLRVSCDLIPIIEKHMSDPYPRLYQHLKAANSPPHKSNLTASSQSPMTEGSQLKKQMIQALDKRLIVLKNTSPEQFKTEMNLQKIFNKSVEGYCNFYESKCEGSVCKMCIDGCFSAFYSYRKKQADDISDSKLKLAVKIKSTSGAETFFNAFAKGICETPKSIWFKSTKPIDCQNMILADIQFQVISTFISSDENEGDVCAQLEK
ncbi:MAG: hypothetical protein V4654_15400 [Bdellovibrionota bacterium]